MIVQHSGEAAGFFPAAEAPSNAPGGQHSPEQQQWTGVDAAEEESLLAHATLSTDQELGAVQATSESQDAEAAFMYLQARDLLP